MILQRTSPRILNKVLLKQSFNMNEGPFPHQRILQFLMVLVGTGYWYLPSRLARHPLSELRYTMKVFEQVQLKLNVSFLFLDCVFLVLQVLFWQQSVQHGRSRCFFPQKNVSDFSHSKSSLIFPAASTLAILADLFRSSYRSKSRRLVFTSKHTIISTQGSVNLVPYNWNNWNKLEHRILIFEFLSASSWGLPGFLSLNPGHGT